MRVVKVSLKSVDDVKKFVDCLIQFDVDFELTSGRYVIDAKSILGIFSLDLSHHLDLQIHSQDDELDDILRTLNPYLI